MATPTTAPRIVLAETSSVPAFPSAIIVPVSSASAIATPSANPSTTPSATSTTSTSSSPFANSVATTSSTLSSSVSTPAPSQVTVNGPDTTTSQSNSNLGLALGLTFGVLALLALILFLVRCRFIRHRRQHRESGQRLAYSKAKYAISAPTDFTVLESGTLGGNGTDRPGTSMSIQPKLEEWGNGGTGERVGSPERMRERYPFETMSGLESGLKDQMQTMKSAQLSSRKPVPVYTVQVDTR